MASTGKDNSATEESGSTPISVAGPETAKEQPRAFLDSGRRNLSEEELATPAARRFLIFEIERLDAQCVELREVERRYGDLRVDLATLKEGSKQSRLNELVSFVCLTVGSAGLGAAPSYISVQSVAGVGWVFVIGSGLLVVAGIASRIFR